MKIILLDVMSLDGKLTRWKDSPASDWASPEDSAYFLKVIRQSKLLVMGSNTFAINRPKPEKERLRIVMTREPEKYQKLAIPGQLEFTGETPKQLVKRLEKAGFKQMLLVGGQKLAMAFFRENLIDEFRVTIEPRIFGKGASLIEEVELDLRLQLFSFEKLNEQGTLLLKYYVRKSI